MSRLKLFPDFRLANGKGRDRPIGEFFADHNVILLTHVDAASHGPAVSLIRTLVAERQDVSGITVRGFDIRSLDGHCDRFSGPHLISEEGDELITICDSGGLIRRLCGVESEAWIMVVNAWREVLYVEPLAEIERLAMQLELDEALPSHRIARAPPEQQ